ncbi:MAG: hypothetical protein ACYDCK_10770 [Thermoplasmatota archaeon]
MDSAPVVSLPRSERNLGEVASLPPSQPLAPGLAPLALFGGRAVLPPGALTLLVASHDALADLEARLLLEVASRGLDSLLICGDNRLNAHRLLALARSRGVEDALADGVHLARAFTVHQFAALLEETLPRLAAARAPYAGVALATGFLDLFLDEDVRAAEARVLLSRTVRRLAEWSREQAFPVVATLAPTASRDAEALLGLASALVPNRIAVGEMRDGSARVYVEPSGERFAVAVAGRHQVPLTSFAAVS